MHEKSVELLNNAIEDELFAVHQYMYFHFLCDDQGYDLLAGLFKRTAIDEMLHVEKLAERILFLKGEVEMKVGGEVEKIKDVAKMLEKAANMEQESARDYNIWANESSANADAMTKQIFEGLVADEERHFDDTILRLIILKNLGTDILHSNLLKEAKVFPLLADL